jgi:AraC-like DNA-binding protein
LRVGYTSEAAFSRAFRRLVGVPPATWRDGKAAESGLPASEPAALGERLLV